MSIHRAKYLEVRLKRRSFKVFCGILLTVAALCIYSTRLYVTVGDGEWPRSIDAQRPFTPNITIRKYGVELEFFSGITPLATMYKLAEPIFQQRKFSVFLNEEDHPTPAAAWRVEAEVDAYTEITSPILGSGGWLELGQVALLTEHLYTIDDFSRWEVSSLHVTIDGKCLVDLTKDSALGILNLLWVWEHFYPVARPYMQRNFIRDEDEESADEKGYGKVINDFEKKSYRARKFARSLGDRFPLLFASLMAQTDVSIGGVEAVFHGLGVQDITNTSVDFLHPMTDGLRNLAVNLCHVLHIKCCADCPHNDVSKHGGIEFRAFDLEVGQRLELAVTLLQHLMHYTCRVTAEGVDLRASDKDVTQMLDFAHWLQRFGLGEQVASWSVPVFDSENDIVASDEFGS